MVCNKCHNEIDNDTIFCKYCGNSVNENNCPPKTKDSEIKRVRCHTNLSNLTKKHKFTIGISIVVVLGIAIVLILNVIFNDPTSKYIDLIDAQNYSEAEKVYEKKLQKAQKTKQD